MFTQLENKPKTVNSILINGAKCVVDKHRTEQQSDTEQSQIMINILFN